MSYTEGRLEEEEDGRGGGRRQGGGGEVRRKVEEEGDGELEPPRALPSTAELEREVESRKSERKSEKDWSESEKDESGLKDAIFTVDAWCGLDCGEGICHQVNIASDNVFFTVTTVRQY